MQLMHNTSPRANSLAVPSPINLIKNYLGVCLDCEFKYIYPHIREDDCYITADRQSGNANVHANQMAIFKKVIQILKRNSPLCPLVQQTSFSKSEQGLRLCTGTFEKSSVEEMGDGRIDADDNFCVHIALNDTARKAEILTSIFYDRIKPNIIGDSFAESYHRTLLAGALEWHLATNLIGPEKESIYLPDAKPENNVRVEIKEPLISLERPTFETNDTKPRRNSSPTSLGRSEIKPSLKMTGSSSEHTDAKVKKTSSNGHRFHLSLHELTISTGSISPKRGETKTSPSQKSISERDALLKLLSASSLYNCRNHWIRSFKHQLSISEVSWEEDEYILVEKHEILKHPMMHRLLQCEISKDTMGDLNIHGLMQDIHRNLAYIDKDHHSGLSAFSRKKHNILDIKTVESKISMEDLERFDSEVSYFYHFINRLLSGLGMINQEDLLKKWKHYATEQLEEGISNESFIFAGEKFFRGMSKDDPYSNKLITLLALLRQRYYVHPITVVHEIISDVPLSFQFDDPKRLMQFSFLKNGLVEFHTSIKAIPSKDAEKWPNKEIKCSGCEIGILNIMRPNNKQLNSWYSEIEINVSIIRPLKDKKSDQIPKNIKDYIIDPLQKVGFKININFVVNRFAESF